MVPTLTEVSRQAIAAGGPPIQFADSLICCSDDTGAVKEVKMIRRSGRRDFDASVVKAVLDASPLPVAQVIGLHLRALPIAQPRRRRAIVPQRQEQRARGCFAARQRIDRQLRDTSGAQNMTDVMRSMMSRR